MKCRWSIDDLPMIEPCFGMNGHPRARMDTILRQCEAEFKIFNSTWFPASIYRSKWSIIAGQRSNVEKSSKKSFFWIFFWFFYRSRGSRPGAYLGVSRTDPRAKKPSNISIFQKLLKINEKLIWPHKWGWFFTLIFIVPTRIAYPWKVDLYQIFQRICKL